MQTAALTSGETTRKAIESTPKAQTHTPPASTTPAGASPIPGLQGRPRRAAAQAVAVKVAQAYLPIAVTDSSSSDESFDSSGEELEEIAISAKSIDEQNSENAEDEKEARRRKREKRKEEKRMEKEIMKEWERQYFEGQLSSGSDIDGAEFFNGDGEESDDFLSDKGPKNTTKKRKRRHAAGTVTAISSTIVTRKNRIRGDQPLEPRKPKKSKESKEPMGQKEPKKSIEPKAPRKSKPVKRKTQNGIVNPIPVVTSLPNATSSSEAPPAKVVIDLTTGSDEPNETSKSTSSTTNDGIARFKQAEILGLLKGITKLTPWEEIAKEIGDGTRTHEEVKKTWENIGRRIWLNWTG